MKRSNKREKFSINSGEFRGYEYIFMLQILISVNLIFELF